MPVLETTSFVARGWAAGGWAAGGCVCCSLHSLNNWVMSTDGTGVAGFGSTVLEPSEQTRLETSEQTRLETSEME